MKMATLNVIVSFVFLSMTSVSLAAGDVNAVTVDKGEIEGIYNYSYNTDPTGFGGATQPEAMKSLADAGYKTVINLRLQGEKGNDLPASRMAASQAGLEYVHLPFDSSNPAPDFFDRYLAALGDEANHPVYMHCGSATRVAALWMSKRVLEDGWSMEEAEAEARAIAGKPDAAVAYAEKYIDQQRK